MVCPENQWGNRNQETVDQRKEEGTLPLIHITGINYIISSDQTSLVKFDIPTATRKEPIGWLQLRQ